MMLQARCHPALARVLSVNAPFLALAHFYNPLFGVCCRFEDALRWAEKALSLMQHTLCRTYATLF
jgi:hypothetical protein